MKPLIITFTAMLCVLISSPLTAEIYKWRDNDGNLHFGDKPPVEANTQKVKLKINTYEDVQVFDGETWSEERKKTRKSAKTKVVMYSTEWCSSCKRAKKYFVKNNIPYTSYDIENNKRAEKEFRAMGATGVPVILVGNKKMLGFSIARFNSIYSTQ